MTSAVELIVPFFLPFQMACGALVKVWAGGITLPTVPSKGSTEMATLHAPHHLTCLDRPLLSTPAALYGHRKGIIFTLLLRGTVVLVVVLLMNIQMCQEVENRVLMTIHIQEVC